jgi:hypothetical protein
MGRKIIGILVGILLITTLIPVIGATSEQSAQPLTQNNEKFKNCYIKADDLLESGDFISLSIRELTHKQLQKMDD